MLIRRALRTAAVLSWASSEQILALASASKIRKLAIDTRLIEEGEQAAEMFVLLSGELEVIKITDQGEEVVVKRCFKLGD